MNARFHPRVTGNQPNNTTMKGADSFGPEKASTTMWPANPYGRTLHFGIREHAMGAILNGITLHGGTRFSHSGSSNALRRKQCRAGKGSDAPP
jgi:hypothetical protein